MRTSSSFVRRLATVAMSVAILPALAALTAGSAAATSPPPAVGVSVDDGTLIHLMNGRVVMRFAISLTRPLTKDEDPVSVRFTTADGTAPANSYHPKTEDLLLGASGAMVDVPVNVRHCSETPRWCDPAFDPYHDAATALFDPEEFLLPFVSHSTVAATVTVPAGVTTTDIAAPSAVAAFACDYSDGRDHTLEKARIT